MTGRVGGPRRWMFMQAVAPILGRRHTFPAGCDQHVFCLYTLDWLTNSGLFSTGTAPA